MLEVMHLIINELHVDESGSNMVTEKYIFPFIAEATVFIHTQQ